MPKLPRESGEKHVAALKRAGWMVNHIEGSPSILIKEGMLVHLSVPVHAGRILGPGLLRKIIAAAGLTPEEYCDLFYRK